MFKSQGAYFSRNKHYADKGFSTRAIHVGSEPGQEFGGVSPVLDFSTTFAQPAPGSPVLFDYSRCGNPARLCFERNLATMEHANYAFACSSGMAAHVTLLNLCKTGDHVMCIDDVYGGTQRYLRHILSPNTGIVVDYSDFSDVKAFKKAIKPNTKLVWLETPTNPTLKIFDIKAIAKALEGTGALFVVDNTFCTSINQNPLLMGADIVTHSVTKYIGGHSDVIGGAMMLNSKELYDRIFFVLKTMGTGMAAFDSWLAMRSSKTLHVRFERA
jgi:cystathionine gamma-lyase